MTPARRVQRQLASRRCLTPTPRARTTRTMSATGRVVSTGIPNPVARRPAASATRRASPASRRASTASRRGETSDATRTGSRSSRDGHVARGTAPYANLDLVRETELNKKERTAMHTFHTQGGRQVRAERANASRGVDGDARYFSRCFSNQDHDRDRPRRPRDVPPPTARAPRRAHLASPPTATR